MNEVYTINALEQVKLLADPFRLRMLELFKGGEPLTTKQVADLLGEKPTKLYHHVEQLEKAGLIILVETKPNKGILEKYYQAAAKTFVVDPQLFADKLSSEAQSVFASMLTSVLESARAQIQQGLASGLITPDAADELLIVHLPVRASKQEIGKIKRALEKSVKQIQSVGQAENNEKNYSLLLAFYPVEQPKAVKRKK